MALTYDEALAFLFPRTTTIKFGLDTTGALLRSLGDPHTVMPAIHIGGTNGKGSVSTLVAESLQAAGWRVGLYTSPHLVSFRERIRVDGVAISEPAVAMWTARLAPLIHELGATFFEATTAMAFADFAARGAEVAVVEVGLGGRLDSTNIVTPVVSAVTKIALDHMKYLGESLDDIAREKAGIAKPGVPFVIGERDPALVEVLRREARRVIRAAGGRRDIRVLPPAYEWTGALGLRGPHQRRNAAVAHGILMALPPRWRPAPEAIAEGFAAARVPGRLDRRGKWLLDVAHNPDGMEAAGGGAPGRPPAGSRARPGQHPRRQGVADHAGLARLDRGPGGAHRGALRRGAGLGPRLAAALAGPAGPPPSPCPVDADSRLRHGAPRGRARRGHGPRHRLLPHGW
jgi:dihydrofolate synthase / folylpolyglutamate synthase